MRIKEQLQLAKKITSMPLMMLMTAGYATVYGLLFGMIFHRGDWQSVLFQTSMWFLFYGYIFFGIAGGGGIVTIFYVLLSFGKDRKTAFSVWTKTVWFSALFSALVMIPCILMGVRLADKGAVNLILGIQLSPEKTDLLKLDAGGGKLILIVLLLIGLGAFFNALIAFFCTVGVRYGWQVTVGTVVLCISLFLVLFVADINILFVTGHNILQYVVRLYAMLIALMGAIYFLAQKWEVKN